ncbi:hypothetical protein BCR32DRAFT_288329 [Anaeromyces robustus]|uniref:Uncharacterized protein n=1 Tax=Anaeromyces robustus TaxID=1754192 RepID=A0A1Y1V0G9_9FUNG|nr:hypothetical protein BCR32DRAFT_288329 [Anaeromyces robustus]|eukprot:ORX43890.1 hypothetical protein BCR32DRAFT_288329 [Anaeromyces robustus]
MVSLVKKIKKIYKGSYFYANRKYGKYTKRRPFPNFNDFDCSPSGDFSLNEVPTEMNNANKVGLEKSNFEKSNSYITSNDNNVNVITEGNNVYMTSVGSIRSAGNVIDDATPANSEIFDNNNTYGLYSTPNSNSISPVTTLSDSNTDFTMVNSNTNEYYQTQNQANPIQNQNLDNPFFDATEVSIFDNNNNSFTNSVDNSMNSNGHVDYYANQMKRIGRYDSNMDDSSDDIKVEYNGKNNWNVEIRRYYPTMPQTAEPMDNYDYHDDSNYNTNNMSIVDTKKKNKWWKKIVPKSGKRDSVISENTFYDNRYLDNDYNTKRYDSSRHSSYYTSYNDEYGSKHNSMSINSYGGNKYNYPNYGRNNTVNLDDVLVVNNNAKRATNSVIF